MLKRASIVSAVAAGLMAIGVPAFATAGAPHDDDHHHHEHLTIWDIGDSEDDHADQNGLINLNDSNLASNINLCDIEVLNIVPILSGNDESVCVNTDDDDNDHNDTEEG